jgi:hypothetical protein
MDERPQRSKTTCLHGALPASTFCSAPLRTRSSTHDPDRIQSLLHQQCATSPAATKGGRHSARPTGSNHSFLP